MKRELGRDAETMVGTSRFGYRARLGLTRYSG